MSAASTTNKSASSSGGSPSFLTVFYHALLKLNPDVEVGAEDEASDDTLCFSTELDYQNYFFPKLLQECRAEIRKEMELVSGSVDIPVSFTEMKTASDFDFVTFQVSKSRPSSADAATVASSSSSSSSLSTKLDFNDLVRITVGAAGPFQSKAMGIAVGGCDGQTIKLRMLPSQSIPMARFTMEKIKRKPPVPIVITKLVGLSPSCREFAAMKSIQSFPLMRSILSATPTLVEYPNCIETLPNKFQEYINRTFNEDQNKAIRSICGRNTRNISMLQGPPGTGKTHVTLGILNILVLSQFQRHYESTLASLDPALNKAPPQTTTTTTASSSSSASSSSHKLSEVEEMRASMLALRSRDTKKIVTAKPHILVCTPSNAAVDELVVRLLQRGLTDSNLNSYTPYIVRIGSSTAISDKVKAVTLDELVGAIMRTPKQMCAAIIRECQANITAIAEKLDRTLKEAKIVAQCGQPTLEFCQSLARDNERKATEQTKMQRYQMMLEPSQSLDAVKEKLRASFLDEAQVVFTTLSSAGLECFRLLGHGFETVIVDEAAQAVELETLIPLAYKCNRLIMVGDPAQLPATVISRSQLYARSLFERIMKIRKEQVYMLTTQYRMHGSIRKFPSDYFYCGALTDSVEICSGGRTAPFHSDPFLRGPWVFVDLPRSRMQRAEETLSLGNRKEALLAASIIAYLYSVYPDAIRKMSISIITPYRQQRHELLIALHKHVPADLVEKIEVATVDSFQGQEKDIVLFSSVRAHAAAGVGFLSDVRRMNVALTRARYALYILGNVNALSTSPPWKALIDYASAQGSVIRADKCPFVVPEALEYRKRPANASNHSSQPNSNSSQPNSSQPNSSQHSVPPPLPNLQQSYAQPQQQYQQQQQQQQQQYPPPYQQQQQQYPPPYQQQQQQVHYQRYHPPPPQQQQHYSSKKRSEPEEGEIDDDNYNNNSNYYNNGNHHHVHRNQYGHGQAKLSKQ